MFGRMVLGTFAICAVVPPVTAEEFRVRDQDEFAAALAMLSAGDRLVLADGEWHDFEMTATGEGQVDSPIVVTVQTPGKVILTGQSNLRIGGDYIEVSGLVFRDGYSPTGEVVSFRLNEAKLARHSRVSEIVIDGFSKLGASIGGIAFPILASSLIAFFGWRTAFPAIGGLWVLLTLPIVLLFFRVAPKQEILAKAIYASPPAVVHGLTVPEGLRSPSFYRLLLATALFGFTMAGLTVHFIPILTDQDAISLYAAGIASLIGIFALIGRLGTGLLLDRFPGHLVGATIFLLPLIGSLLLIFDGSSAISQSVAAASFGLAAGAEVYAIAYLAARYMGLRNYGVLFGAMVGALGLGSAFGPLAAGAAYDSYGSYLTFLTLTLGACALSCTALATLGRPLFGGLNRSDIAEGPSS